MNDETAPTTPGTGPEDAVDNPLRVLREAMAEQRDLDLLELARAADVPVRDAQRFVRATGRDRRGVYGPRDVAYLERVKLLSRHLPMDALERAARVRMRSLISIVTSDLATSQEHVARPLLESGADTERVVDALLTLVEDVQPAIAAMLADDYLEVMEQMLGVDAVARAHARGGSTVRLAVGFVDLVGYTRLSASIDPEGLHEVLGDFERHVHEAADTHEVIVTKYIGDAAMLVAEEPRRAVAAVLDLVTSPRAERARAARRGAVTYGDVVAREGDYVGSSVNLAARLTDMARPGTVLAGPELGPDGPDLGSVERSRLDEVEVRGVGEMRPWRLRPAGE